MKTMRNSSKRIMPLILAASLIVATCGLGACSSSKTTTMHTPKKYKTSKTVKSNISVRGTNSKNGSTYRSY